jgi:predicted nucleic acid-binding protein
VNLAIGLRQQRKMSLGDALIAATALEHNLTLATHNEGDFSWVPGLRFDSLTGIT